MRFVKSTRPGLSCTLAGLGVLSSLSTAAPALAAEAAVAKSDDLQEVVVTARRREEFCRTRPSP